MNVFWFLIAVLAILWISILILLRGYKNPKRPHRKTPQDSGIPFQEVRFPTHNNCQLYGWWIPAAPGIKAPVIILVHGWGQNVEYLLPYIEQLHPQGFHLLAFDARNHGSSDSDGYANMLKFAEDIRAAVEFASESYGHLIEWPGVVGFSIGGAAAIYAAAHDDRIQRVVTIGAFAHPAELMKLEFKKRHIPYFPLVWLLFEFIQFKIGARFTHIAPMNNIAGTSAEIFIIHGKDDKIVPVEQALKLNEKGDSSRTLLWLLDGMGHFDCHKHPDFHHTVTAFLKEGLHPHFREEHFAPKSTVDDS